MEAGLSEEFPLSREYDLDRTLVERFLTLDSTLKAGDLEGLIRPLLVAEPDNVEKGFEALRHALREALRPFDNELAGSYNNYPYIALFFDIKNLAIGAEKKSSAELRGKMEELGLSTDFGDMLIKCREGHITKEVDRHYSIISKSLIAYERLAAKARATLTRMVDDEVDLPTVQKYASDALSYISRLEQIDSYARSQVTSPLSLLSDPRLEQSEYSKRAAAIAKSEEKLAEEELGRLSRLATKATELLRTVSPQAWFSLMPKLDEYRHSQLCEYVDIINQHRNEASDIKGWIRSNRYDLEKRSNKRPEKSNPDKIDCILFIDVKDIIAGQLAQALASNSDREGLSIREKLVTLGIPHALALFLIDNLETLKLIKAES